jgi:anti-anti-sigma regulatory factor
VAIRNAAQQRGLPTTIVGASARIARLLTITGLAEAFNLEP